MKIPKFKLDKKRAVAIAFFAILPLLALFYFFPVPGALAEWWDSDWYFRQAITLTNNTSEETNVYISLTLDTSDTTKFQPDCGDIRFLQEDNNNLSYFIVSGCGATSTLIHVNYERFPAGAQTLYLYYGNESADNGNSQTDFSAVASSYTLGLRGPVEQGPAPALYLPLDEGFGSTAHDETSYRNDGTIVGATWQNEDQCKSGKCLAFDGNGDYIEIADDPSLSLSTEMTLEAWIKPISTSPQNQTIISKEEKPVDPTKIYRSVGPSATTAIAVGTSNAMNITGDRATFATALPDNVGVGDVIQYDDDDDGNIDANDSLAFITERLSSQEYRVANASGAVPTPVNSDNNWSLFRAYTSLANAEKGVENTGIDSDLRNFDDWTAGGDATTDDVGRDLVAANQQWNIACYANGTTADTTAVTIGGWTTGIGNFINIYTPISSNDVGVSQRHNGKWDANKYKLEVAANAIWVSAQYVKIDGLQVYASTYGIAIGNAGGSSPLYIFLNNIVKGNSNAGGLYVHATNTFTNGESYFLNNIVYGFSQGIGSNYTSTKVYFYNNTVSSSDDGYTAYAGTIVAKNNIAQNCTGDDFHGSTGFNSFSSDNVSNDFPSSSNAFGATYTSSTTNATTANKLINSAETFITKGVQVGSIIKNTTDNTYTYVTALDSETQLSIANDIFVSGENYSIYKNKYGNVSFVSTTAGSEDFHLSPTDTVAKNSGADLSGDSVFPFASDIDGQERLSLPQGGSTSNVDTRWDIGADEAQATQIYRSVAPNKTDALEDGEDNSMTIVGNIATFQRALADNVGVGDVIQYDDDGDGDIDANDSLAFITGRISNFKYQISNSTGGVPTPVSNDNDWSLFRAYTSLANAESGYENSGIDSDLRNFDSWTGGKDLVASKEQWNIACYANGTVKDTGWVPVSGWETGPMNYINIYSSENDRAELAAWRTDKYIHSNADSITLGEDYVRVDGIQKEILGDSIANRIGIEINGSGINTDIRITNNRIKGGSFGTGEMIGVTVGGDNTNVLIANNIIENLISPARGKGFQTNSSPNVKIFNNIFYNLSQDGMVQYVGTPSIVVKNNAVFNTGNDFVESSYFTIDHNASDDGTGANAIVPTDWNNVFVDYANGDFRLKPTGTDLRNVGVDLSSEGFDTDIDGDARERTASSSWDIGADEAAATKIYRSVGPGNTSALATDEAHDNEVEVTAGVATFEVDLPDRIGVGDALIIDTAGTANVIDASDTLLFIHGRIDSKNYLVRTHTGALPSDIASNDTYSLYRAYTSLANTENGTKNTSIPMAFNGGNRDLVTNNEEWNIACYGDGVDTTAVIVDGWITGIENFIRIYTPVDSDEAGVSQRHNGKWDRGRYVLEGFDTSNVGILGNYEENVRIDGLQIRNTGTFNAPGVRNIASGVMNFYFSNNIIRGNIASYVKGIMFGGADRSNNYVWNNIIYDFTGTESAALYPTTTNGYYYFYNNALLNNSQGISIYGGNVIARNNIVIGSGNSYSYIGTFSEGTDYNLTDSTDNIGVGMHNKVSQTVTFRDAANDDYRLAMTDTAAKGAGINLSYDVNLPVTHDIEGELRPGFCGMDGGDEACLVSTGGVFDIGADQISGTIHRNYSLTLDNDYPRAYQSTGNDDNESFSSGDIDLPANEWSHIVYKRDNDREELYINGARKDSAAISDFLKTNKGKLYIGAQDANSKNSFKGFLDEVRLYPYARTADEIKKDTTQGSSGRAAARASEGVGVAIGDSGNSLSDGLVGYWKMDEASWNGTANEVIDHSGNNNHGVAVGGASTTGGRFGNGGTFDGTSDYINLSNNPILNNAGAITLSAWINPQTIDDWERVISKSYADNREYMLMFNNVDGISFSVYNTLSTEFQVSSNTSLPLNQWSHVVGVFNGTTVKIFVNGIEQSDTENFSGTIKTFSYNVIIGAEEAMPARYYFDGKIDETRIYNRALSPDEIKQLYNYAPGPVLHLKMDEKSGTTAFDSSGNNNHGTLVNGPIWETGKINGGLNFDGANDYVDVGNIPSLNFGLSSFSVGHWIKVAELPESDGVTVNKLDNSYADGWWFGIRSDGAVGFWFRWDGTHYHDIITSGLSLNKWHYVVANIDRNNNFVKLYLDGIEQGSRDISGWGDIDAENDPLRIAMRRIDYPYFKGDVDDVRIYNYARTPEQILEDMNAQSGSIIGREGAALKQPILDLSFDEGFGPRAFDASGNNNHGTLYSGTTGANATSSAMWDKGGKIGGAMEFDGVDDYINAGSGSSVDNIFNGGGSVSFWLYSRSGGEIDHGRVIDKSNDIEAGGGWALQMEGGDSLFIDRAFTLNHGHFIFDDCLTVNSWNYVTLIYDDTSSANRPSLYVNGEKFTSYRMTLAPSGTASDDSAYNFIIGNFSTTGTRTFDGLIDEVKIYNYALSEAEIKTLYNGSAVANMGAGTSRNNNGTTVTGENMDYCVPGDTARCDKPVLELKFDEKQGSMAFDTSGNGRNGTLRNGPIWDRGKVGNSLNFNGAGQDIDGIPNVNIQGNFTISAWIKPETLFGERTIFYAWGDFFVLQANSLLRWARVGTGCLSNSTGVDVDWVSSGNVLVKDEWQYATFVSDATNNNIYIYHNGKPIKIASGKSDCAPNSGLEYIGSTLSRYFDGNIDEVRIYDYARTPAQIAWDYNRGKPINEWRFDEGAGTVVHDQGPNRNNGTITGAVWKSGNECNKGSAQGSAEEKCLYFDGEDLTGINVDTNDNMSNFTACAWIKTGSYLNTDNDPRLMILSKFWSFSLLNDGTLRFVIPTTSIYPYFITTQTISLNQWHRVCASYSGLGQIPKIYVNGQVASGAGTVGEGTLSDDSARVLTIGVNASGYYEDNFYGYIDDPKIYNYALTAEQIKLDYNGGAVGFR